MDARSQIQEVVDERLKALGIDVDQPHETQADMHHLRKTRLIDEKLGAGFRTWLVRVAYSLGITGLIAAIAHANKVVRGWTFGS